MIALSVVVLLMTSCDQDKEDLVQTPASKIVASESLSIPAEITLPANPGGHTRISTLYADGVQKYVSKEKTGTPGVFEWSFVAPQANLFDQTNKKIGTHSAGPTWQLSVTDSIYAQAFSPAKTAPSPEAGNIPWLLLKTKEGKTPTGAFAGVEYIQRIATTGGIAPANAPTAAGQTVEVAYTAIYRFSKRTL